MIDPDGLNVWSDQRLVGFLWRNIQGLIGFRYHEVWLSDGGFRISSTLPLGPEEFSPEDGIAHRFFANLLPEGGVRDRLVRDLKIANTDFDLLRAIGGECAGALSLLEAEHQPATKHRYRRITDEELAELASGRGRVRASSEDGHPRLSLAGAQDKCPVLVEQDNYWMPMRESPSSHILKFELPDFSHLPAYETFTTMLAGAIGLPVVDIQLRSIANTRFALIQRYDRQRSENGEISRLHQEDFCQALGFGHERKYQAHGGPRFANCYGLVRDHSTEPAVDLQHLLRWQIFNLLAGNSDGHAKNLSLLYHADGAIRVAPFYDLVCTRAIERIDPSLAFSVGDEKNPGVVSQKHWDALAQECGVRPRFLQAQVQDVAAKLLQTLRPSMESFQSLYGEYPALQRIEQVVTKQCRRVVSDRRMSWPP